MKRIIFIFLLLTIFSCKDIVRSIVNSETNNSESISDKNFNKIKIDDLFDISIPKYMKKATNLNEDASLQYANLYKEAYIVVTSENKNEFEKTFKEFNEYDKSKSILENYTEARIKMFREIMQINDIEHYGLKDINGFNAKQFKIKGNIDNIDIFYLIALVETDKDFYLIMNWTLLDRLKRFESTFEIMNASFNKIGKEIKVDNVNDANKKVKTKKTILSK